MFCFRKPDAPVSVARAEGKTIQESEEKCYQIALARCPSFPKPPFFARSQKTRRVVPILRAAAEVTTVAAKTARKKQTRSSKPARQLG